MGHHKKSKHFDHILWLCDVPLRPGEYTAANVVPAYGARHVSFSLTELISHHSSHTTHFIHNPFHPQPISLISHSFFSHNSSHRRVAWQALYAQHPEGAAARIGAAVAARAQYAEPPEGAGRSCGADRRRRGHGMPRLPVLRVVAAVAAGTCCALVHPPVISHNSFLPSHPISFIHLTPLILHQPCLTTLISNHSSH